MKYIVIGANGFLGSLIVNLLSNDNTNEVVAFDRYRNSQNFILRSNVAVLVGDVTEIANFRSAFKNVDTVFHCFSVTRPGQDLGRTKEIFTQEVIPSRKIIELCVEMGVRRIVYCSSGGAIYGESLKLCNSELQTPRPLTPYGDAKLEIENSLLEATNGSATRPLILRIANPYGPEQIKHRQGLIPSIFQNLQMGIPQKVFGDGTIVRDYLYTKDLMVMLNTILQGEPKYQIYNLGTGVGISINEIIAIVERILAVTIPQSTEPAQLGTIKHSVLDINRYLDEFGDFAWTNIITGVESFVGNFSEIKR